MYTKEDKLMIHRRIGVTKEVYDILRTKKQREGQSMAKIITNLILKIYGKKDKNKTGGSEV